MWSAGAQYHTRDLRHGNRNHGTCRTVSFWRDSSPKRHHRARPGGAAIRIPERSVLPCSSSPLPPPAMAGAEAPCGGGPMPGATRAERPFPMQCLTERGRVDDSAGTNRPRTWHSLSWHSLSPDGRTPCRKTPRPEGWSGWPQRGRFTVAPGSARGNRRGVPMSPEGGLQRPCWRDPLRRPARARGARGALPWATLRSARWAWRDGELRSLPPSARHCLPHSAPSFHLVAQPLVYAAVSSPSAESVAPNALVAPRGAGQPPC